MLSFGRVNTVNKVPTVDTIRASRLSFFAVDKGISELLCIMPIFRLGCPEPCKMAQMAYINGFF